MRLSEESLVAILAVIVKGFQDQSDITDALRSLEFEEKNGRLDLEQSVKDLVLHGKMIS